MITPHVMARGFWRPVTNALAGVCRLFMKGRGPSSLLMLLLLLTAPAFAEIYTVYSDNGFPPSTAPFPVSEFSGVGPPPNSLTGWNGQSTQVVPPEGFTSFSSTSPFINPGFLGWAFDYGSGQNLSRFHSGEFRFWINSTTPNIKIEIQDPSKFDIVNVNLQNPPFNGQWKANQWVDIRIPLSGLPLLGQGSLNSVEFPCVFTALTGPVTFYIDNVRYVDSTVSSPYFNVALHNISDNSPATQVTWSNTNAGSAWRRADQYLQMDLDANTTGAWGVQIYTDNKAVDANPKFTGPPPADPSGLVDLSNTTRTLPMAWSIKATTATILPGPSTVANPPSPAEPNDNGVVNPAVDPNAFQWLYGLDLQSPTFANGEVFAQVKNNLGIHFGQGVTLDAFDFGAAAPPNYIYFEANFASALAPHTFQTSTLRIEFFYP